MANRVLKATDLTIDGNLVVTGTTASVESTNSTLKDNIIVLNQGETGAGVTLVNAGLEIDRGTEDNAQLVWDEVTDKWLLKVGTTVTGTLAGSWTDLTDTPSTITASKFVKSNAGGTALEFVDEADPVFLASAAGTITTAKIANWDEAHGWGNHALAGYLTSTEDNTHANIGSGAKVYDETSGNDIKLRTLVAGDGVRIEQRTQDIFISGDEYLLKSRALTTDAVPVQILWDTSQDGVYSETISPASEECWFFTATFLARRTGGTVERNAFKLEGLVDNTLGTVGLVGPAAKTVYQNNATQWDVSVEVLLEKLVFKVFGETGKDINWTIHLRYQPASETVNYGLDP